MPFTWKLCLAYLVAKFLVSIFNQPLNTEELRKNFACESLMQDDKINLVYSHYDRRICSRPGVNTFEPLIHKLHPVQEKFPAPASLNCYQ
jgi:hypothetical protein